MTNTRRFLAFFGLEGRHPAIQGLVLGLVGLHAVALVLALLGRYDLYRWGALEDHAVLGGQVWRLLTYGLLHDLGDQPLIDHLVSGLLVAGIVVAWRSPLGQRDPTLVLLAAIILQVLVSALGHGEPLHLVLNLAVIVWFGSEFARRWGTRRFVVFIAACVAGGAVVCVAGRYAVSSWLAFPVVGISAAARGFLVATAVYEPGRVILASMVVPLKAVYLVVLAGAMDLIDLIPSRSVISGMEGVAPQAGRALCHLGGMLVAWLLTSGAWRLGRRRSATPPRPRPSHLRVVKNDDRWIH